MKSGIMKRLAIGILCIVLLLTIALAYITDFESLGSVASGDRLERIIDSPNYDGKRFVNSEPTSRLKDGSTWSLVTKFVSSNERSRPKLPLKIIHPDLSDPDSADALKITWLGHATVFAEIDGLTLLTDPIFNEEVTTLTGHARRFHDSPIELADLPRIDIVVISHDHHDHLENSTIEFLALTGTMFILPLGVGMHLERWGVADSQIVELDWWQSVTIKSVEIVCTPARHTSGRTIFESDQTLWASWTIIGPEHRLFYGSDTGFGKQFEKIGRLYGPFDISLLPIGAYDTNWPDIHLIPEEAVNAQIALRGKLLLPVHWGTFNVAFHPWDEPITRLVEAANVHGVKIVAPRPGEIVTPRQEKSYDHWWQ